MVFRQTEQTLPLAVEHGGLTYVGKTTEVAFFSESPREVLPCIYENPCSLIPASMQALTVGGRSGSIA